MNKIADYFIGYYLVRAKGGSTLNLLNYMMKCRIAYSGLRRISSAEIEFYISGKAYKRILKFAEDDGTEIAIVRKCGLPALLYRYRMRLGLFVGILIFAFAVRESSSYIWRIDVSGNTEVPSEKIIAELGLLGCGVGAKISDIDFFELCNDYIAASEDISWISVNLRGTVASVEVREQKNITDSRDNSPSNIVAARSGQIESIGSYSGMCVVKNGDIVSEGQLLISGFDEDKNGEIKLSRAAGHIMAYTAREIKVSVPYKSEQKVYTGNTVTEKTLNIFGKMIKLYKKTGNYGTMYDKIEDKDSLVLFDKIYLPFSVSTVSYNEYSYEEIILNEAEAKAIAEAELREKLRNELGDAELLGINVKTSLTGDDPENEAYTIECTVRCLENIAEEQIIEIASDKNQ